MLKDIKYSNFIGEIGKKIVAEVIVKKYIIRSKWKNKLFLMQDNDGNIYTISSVANFKIGKKFILDGIVKSHTYFNGQKQTHLRSWGILIR